MTYSPRRGLKPVAPGNSTGSHAVVTLGNPPGGVDRGDRWRESLTVAFTSILRAWTGFEPATPT